MKNQDYVVDTDNCSEIENTVVGKLEKDIKLLKKERDKLIKKNQRNKKKGLFIAKVTLPYLITAGVLWEGCSLFGGRPFFIDDRDVIATVKKEADTLGNTSYDEQYDEKDIEYESTVSYIEKWHQDGDGSWTRNVKTFDLSNIKKSEKDIDPQIFNGMGKEALEYFLGEPIADSIERKTTISEAEQNASPYLKTTVYYDDENKSKSIKESAFHNYIDTFIYLIFTILEGTVAASILASSHTKIANRTRNERINEIEEEIEKTTKEINIINKEESNQKTLKKKL